MKYANHAEYLWLRGGKYDGKRVYDPQILILEDHIVAVSDADENWVYYLINDSITGIPCQPVAGYRIHTFHEKDLF